MNNTNYNPNQIEKKWQEVWERRKIFSPDLDQARKPFYNLMMFPYPSAEGFHVGNMYAFTGADIYGRFMQMRGFDVFEPIGLDGFGIHSENFAIKIREHPTDVAARTEKNFYRQLRATGNAYDWTRTLETYDPDYYKWTQWIFIQMFKHGLAYRAKAPVNWCPSCKTVLADEQVIAGRCERCASIVEIRHLEQWFFKITDYAERLLEGLEKINWSERVKIAQRNWIGRSEGAEIRFTIYDLRLTIPVFTTRSDTLFGATFLVLSPDSDWVEKVTTSKFKKELEKYLKRVEKEKTGLPGEARRAKEGVFTGSYAINPATGEKIPIWVADYVVGGYGSGAIMGVPAHDQRDFEFAKKYDLPIVPVIQMSDVRGQISDSQMSEKSAIRQTENRNLKSGNLDLPYSGEGILIDSGRFTGLRSEEARRKLAEWLKKEGIGGPSVSYHLRDWLISRQRYWGPPIPMVFCQECAKEGRSWFTTDEAKHALENTKHTPRSGTSAAQNTKQFRNLKLEIRNSAHWAAGWYPVSEKDLPVRLPYIKNYRPRGTGESPLAQDKTWVQVTCPQCRYLSARRETDVSDTFFDSSWYYLGYLILGEQKPAWPSGRSKIKNHKIGNWELPARNATQSVAGGEFRDSLTRRGRWLPVHMYIGGAEHAVLHLMYVRFITKALHDWGYLPFHEPFQRFFAHGLLIAEGAKMSKSRGNVVVPDEYIKKFGADTLRCYLMFLGPFNQGGDFRDTGIEGMHRFVKRVWDLVVNFGDVVLVEEGDTQEVLQAQHKTVKLVTGDLENLRYNTAISHLMEFVNLLRKKVLRGEKGTAGRKPSLHRTNVRCAQWDEALRTLVLLLAPFASYMTEELWQLLKNKTQDAKWKTNHQSLATDHWSAHFQPWPEYSEELIIEEEVEIPVQVDGRLRDTIKVKSQIANRKSQIEKKASESIKVRKYIEGKKIKRVVFVSGKLLNFVTS